MYKADEVEKDTTPLIDERARALALSKIYPQPTGDGMTFRHNPVPLPLTTTVIAGVKVSWRQLVVFSLGLPLPLVIADVGISKILDQSSKEGRVGALFVLLAIPLLLATIGIFIFVKKQALRFFANIAVNPSRVIGWYVICIVPIIIALRLTLALASVSWGVMAMGYIIGSLLMSIGVLCTLFFLLERTKKDPSTRLTYGLMFTSLPYVVGGIYALARYIVT